VTRHVTPDLAKIRARRGRSEGSFPDIFKQAIVMPLIKKQTLPKDELSSYRPISSD
jgi:hypothetical protein